MKKIVLLLIVLLGFTFLLLVNDKEVHKPYKIGIVTHATLFEDLLKGFKDGMREHGIVEGKDVVYIDEGATGSISTLTKATQRLVKRDVDLILALGTPAGLAAKKVTQTIPIVFAPGNNPVKTGLIKNPYSPSQNITGVTYWLHEQKRLGWFLRMVPTIKNIYLPYNAQDESPKSLIEPLKKLLAPQGIELIISDVRNRKEMKKSLQQHIHTIDAIYFGLDALVGSHADLYIEAALQHKIPLAAAAQPLVKKGALMAYGFDFYDTGKQASRMAKEILQGALIKDIPIEYAESKLSVNIETAKKIGLSIDPLILRQARLY